MFAFDMNLASQVAAQAPAETARGRTNESRRGDGQIQKRNDLARDWMTPVEPGERRSDCSGILDHRMVYAWKHDTLDIWQRRSSGQLLIGFRRCALRATKVEVLGTSTLSESPKTQVTRISCLRQRMAPRTANLKSTVVQLRDVRLGSRGTNDRI